MGCKDRLEAQWSTLGVHRRFLGTIVKVFPYVIRMTGWKVFRARSAPWYERKKEGGHIKIERSRLVAKFSERRQQTTAMCFVKVSLLADDKLLLVLAHLYIKTYMSHTDSMRILALLMIIFCSHQKGNHHRGTWYGIMYQKGSGTWYFLDKETSSSICWARNPQTRT